MIDHKLTVKLKRWLEADSHTDTSDIIEGATMLLQLNRNQAMYNTIVRSPEKYVEKIEYELRKFLPMRLASMTVADVKQLDGEITPVIQNAIETAVPDADDDRVDNPASFGKRLDHESLPEDIRKIWDLNTERWFKIKELYNTCLSLTEACDRYEYLTMLKETWYKYKAEYERYDSYNADGIQDGAASGLQPETDPVTLARQITNARAYISKNLDNLIALHERTKSEDATTKDVDAYNVLAAKVKERLEILVKNSQVIGQDIAEKILNSGITCDGLCLEEAE